VWRRWTCEVATEDEFVEGEHVFGTCVLGHFELGGVNVGELGHGWLIWWCLGGVVSCAEA